MHFTSIATTATLLLPRVVSGWYIYTEAEENGIEPSLPGQNPVAFKVLQAPPACKDLDADNPVAYQSDDVSGSTGVRCNGCSSPYDGSDFDIEMLEYNFDQAPWTHHTYYKNRGGALVDVNDNVVGYCVTDGSDHYSCRTHLYMLFTGRSQLRCEWGSPTPEPPPPKQKLKAMVVGDSLTHGREGDFTWRYRLWEWLDSSGVDVDFVGPLHGTFPPPPAASAKPKPPLLEGEEPFPTADLDSGEYAKEILPGFPTKHYAQWGRQAAQVVDKIDGVVALYKPDYVLIMLGFNDLGWFVSGPDGTVETMKKVVRNVQSANPDATILVSTVVQRTLIKIVNEELPDKTSTYNLLLRQNAETWSTERSKVKVVETDRFYDCHPSACPDGYDGLHPNAQGEISIAGAFAGVLHYDFNFGNQPFFRVDPPSRNPETPANVKAEAVPAGIVVNWDKQLGATGYDVRKRRKGQEWQQLTVSPNAYWETWVFNDEEWEFQVRTLMGDDDKFKSNWSPIVSAVAHPETAPGPKNIVGVSTGSGIRATWDPVTDWPVERYELTVFDTDTSGAILQSVGTKTTSATISGLISGHSYIVAVVTWTDVGGGFPAVGMNVVV